MDDFVTEYKKYTEILDIIRLYELYKVSESETTWAIGIPQQSISKPPQK